MKKGLILMLVFIFLVISCSTNKNKINYNTVENGCISGDCKNGDGTYIFSNKVEYNDEGNQIMVWGGKYDGEWKDGKYNGKGIFTSAKGDEYDGEWKDGKYNGDGTLTYVDGSEYDGEWKDGDCNGKGTLTFASDDKYEGDFKDGKFNGKGIYSYANGSRYEGDFKDGKFNGKGILYDNVEGTKYTGNFKDNKKNGQGYLYESTDNRYLNYSTEGEWKDNNLFNGEKLRLSGKGIYYKEETVSTTVSGKITYSGGGGDGCQNVPSCLEECTKKYKNSGLTVSQASDLCLSKISYAAKVYDLYLTSKKNGYSGDNQYDLYKRAMEDACPKYKSCNKD